MNFWQFLDRQFMRLKVDHVAGAGVFLLTGAVLLMLQHDRELAQNDLFKTLAQAIVVQGLVGLAMAAWFTTKHRDKVEVTNDEQNPVRTEDVG